MLQGLRNNHPKAGDSLAGRTVPTTLLQWTKSVLSPGWGTGQE